ncbi:uncharacterized protein BX663DRAFT_526326 [Cokeromyces recurvatus]|uniref:uncharacterized protein n=1 Tax=Cokeromyces recurvatus TaxID=90255 RepID=UPI0022209EEA|nr:uncharacterized protein BX663DRAFT_526326 [Cokeromyces recurvatus]KAI7898015.1 hypothetical protein BX663DRAFT_526326 [Cokeromyces recurvatus]
MTILSTPLLTLLIIIPAIPLCTYIVGLLIPASHIVSRTAKFKRISSKELWDILIDVSKYPVWQPKIEKVTIEDQEEKGNRVVFVEHSIRKRVTIFIHHERIPYQSLIRILEERSNSQEKKRAPTFSGSWTFELTTETKDDVVTLKITEQGVIQQPIVRLTHLLLFGFHRRIDRFMNDLSLFISQEEVEKRTNLEKTEGSNDDCNGLHDNNVYISGEHQELQQSDEASKTSHNEPAIVKEALIENNDENNKDVDDEKIIKGLSAYDSISNQQVDTNDIYIKNTANHISLAKSKLTPTTEKDWDFMSEIYERPF